MKKYSPSSLAFIFSLFLIACHSAPQGGKASFTYTWDVDSRISSFQYIDSVQYILLESHPDGLFKNIDKLLIRNGRIYLLDFRGTGRLFVFDLSGRFLYTVGKKGKAPGEYGEIRNFTVSQEHIYLLDNVLGRLHIFDSEGHHQNSREMPFIAYDLALLDNGDYLFCWQPLKGVSQNNRHKVFHTDINLNILHAMLPVNESDADDLSKMRFFTENEHAIVYHTLLSDTLYFFNRHDPTNMETCLLDFQSDRLPMQARKHSDTERIGKYLHNTPFVTDKYIIGDFIDEYIETFLLDRTKQKVVLNHDDDSIFLLDPLYYDGRHLVTQVPNGWYSDLLEGGFPSAPQPIKEKLLSGEDYGLILYTLK